MPIQAVLCRNHGGPEALVAGEAPDPSPGLSSDEVLIQVRAAGVNNADVLQRKGLYPPPPGASPILGLEVAGEVVRTGPQAKRAKAGDRVMALLSGGGYAEKVRVPESQTMPVPSTDPPMPFTAAAGIPEAFLTAYLELFKLGELKRGETVLVHAGASGVGSAAIQLAREAGAVVFATAGSEEKLALCRELGAAAAFNYKTEEFDRRVLAETGGRGVSCILDLVGAAHLAKNLSSLAVEGRLLMVGLSGGAKAEIELRPILAKRLRIIGSTLRARSIADKADLIRDFSAFALPLFGSGKLRPVIDRVFRWTDAADAHRFLESARNRGKVILEFP